jgi:hypothetical protein
LLAYLFSLHIIRYLQGKLVKGTRTRCELRVIGRKLLKRRALSLGVIESIPRRAWTNDGEGISCGAKSRVGAATLRAREIQHMISDHKPKAFLSTKSASIALGAAICALAASAMALNPPSAAAIQTECQDGVACGDPAGGSSGGSPGQGTADVGDAGWQIPPGEVIEITDSKPRIPPGEGIEDDGSDSLAGKLPLCVTRPGYIDCMPLNCTVDSCGMKPPPSASIEDLPAADPRVITTCPLGRSNLIVATCLWAVLDPNYSKDRKWLKGPSKQQREWCSSAFRAVTFLEKEQQFIISRIRKLDYERRTVSKIVDIFFDGFQRKYDPWIGVLSDNHCFDDEDVS